jgi:hypothetical protein
VKSTLVDLGTEFTDVVQKLYESSQIVSLKAEDMWLQVLVIEKFQKELSILVVRGVEPTGKPILYVRDWGSGG